MEGKPVTSHSTRGMFVVGCCASTVNGHATALLLKRPMNSRHFMGFSLAENHLHQSLIRSSDERYAPIEAKRPVDVRFGSKADIASIERDVRFTPKSGHFSAA
jgi:hypothetical protein